MGACICECICIGVESEFDIDIGTGGGPNLTGEVKHSRDPAIRVVLLPRDTNSRGTIFGGIILSYIDLAGAAQVSKITQQRFVTVAMKEVVFKAPVLVGEIVSFYTATTKVGRTSVSVHVDVEVDRNGQCIPVTEADLTYVCVDATGKPIPVEYPNR